jgi:hypothetical protein
VSSGPPDHGQQGRRAGDEGDEVLEEGLAGVLAVVLFGRGAVDRAQFSGHHAQLLALEAANDLSDKTTLNAVGLHNDKSAVHGERD